MSTLLRWARDRAGLFQAIMMATLAALLILNLGIHPHEVHLAFEGWYGFWAVFGLGCSVGMTFVLKKIVFQIISRPEDFYDQQ